MANAPPVALGPWPDESADDGGDHGTSIEARGLGFGEYLAPACECEQEDDG